MSDCYQAYADQGKKALAEEIEELEWPEAYDPQDVHRFLSELQNIIDQYL